MKNKLNPQYAEATGDKIFIQQAQELSQSFLSQFTGTEKWYQITRMNRTVCTDGAKHVADTAGAWWLLDLIISWQLYAKIREETFQVWKLEVWEDHSATVTATDGNENVIAKQEIPSTNFPVPEMTLWYINSGGLPTILLPSEY